MKRKILCVFLCIVFVFYAFSITTAASVITTERNHVETIAVDYITQYVNNTYLYQTNDLTVGTANQIFSGKNTRQSYRLDDESVSAAELCDRMTSFRLAADYYRYIRTEQNIVRYNFTCTPTIVSTKMDGNYASVHVYTYITFRYQPNSTKTAECGDNYVVHLLKIDGAWYIVDVEAEALIAYGMTNLVETYDDLIAEFDARPLDVASNETAEPQRSITGYDRAYNVNNAIAYAYTYATQSYIGDYNNASFLNDNFHDYTYENGNCQNYVSQCIWAGFGGVNTATAISSLQFPMYNNWNPQKSEWVSVNKFYGEVTSSDSKFNALTYSINGSFSAVPLTILPGSTLQVRSKNRTNYHHALLITDVFGTAYTQIEICGNSPMRKAVMLGEIYEPDMRLIVPQSMQNGRTCTAASHSFDGVKNKCSNCGFIKLNVTGDMLKPVAVGTTHTLTATANPTAICYRMAICISYNGQDAWTEYTITNQISKTYTFSHTGLYTITVVARDLDPNNADSVTATHVYTIRVY